MLNDIFDDNSTNFINKIGGSTITPEISITAKSNIAIKSNIAKIPITLPSYSPATINIPTISYDAIFNNIDISDKKIDIDNLLNLSIDIDYPKFSLGFHHYLHASKGDIKTKILKQFDGKKKVYLIMNDFEVEIDNYDKSISNELKTFLNITHDLDNDFYNFWELLFMFDIIDINQENLTSIHLTEGYGGLMYATTLFKDTYSKKSKSKSNNDLYYYNKQLHNDILKHTFDLNKNILNYYNQNKIKNLIMLDNKTKTPEYNSIDLITSDISLEWIDDDNAREHNMYELLINEIDYILKYQIKGGNFVCKIFESYNLTTTKIITILSSLYNKVFIVKPLSSNFMNTEKYIICLDFKLSTKSNDYKNITKIFDILVNKLKKNNLNLNIVDLMPNYKISSVIIAHITQINRDVGYRQFKTFNSAVQFVQEQNYYGDVYKTHRDIQIDATKFWLDIFLADPKQFKEHKTKAQELSFITNKINVDKSVKMNKILD